jgi:type I restriction enzyme M protein
MYAQRVKANVLFFDRTPVSESLWTKQLWTCDLRTNQHFTLKTNPLTRSNLDEIVACDHLVNCYERTTTWSPQHPTGRWRAHSYDVLLHQDKVSLDLFRLKDESLEDSADLRDPDVLATDFSEILPTALEQFETIPDDRMVVKR